MYDNVVSLHENDDMKTNAHDTIRAWIRAIFYRSICHLVTISTGASIFLCADAILHAKSSVAQKLIAKRQRKLHDESQKKNAKQKKGEKLQYFFLMMRSEKYNIISLHQKFLFRYFIMHKQIISLYMTQGNVLNA